MLSHLVHIHTHIRSICMKQTDLQPRGHFEGFPPSTVVNSHSWPPSHACKPLVVSFSLPLQYVSLPFQLDQRSHSQFLAALEGHSPHCRRHIPCRGRACLATHSGIPSATALGNPSNPGWWRCCPMCLCWQEARRYYPCHSMSGCYDYSTPEEHEGKAR